MKHYFTVKEFVDYAQREYGLKLNRSTVKQAFTAGLKPDAAFVKKRYSPKLEVQFAGEKIRLCTRKSATTWIKHFLQKQVKKGEK